MSHRLYTRLFPHGRRQAAARFLKPVTAALFAATCFTLLLLPGRAAAQMEERSLQLEVNQQTTLPSQGVANYSVTGENIIRVAVDPTTTDFLIVALQQGDATLLLLYQDGRRVLYRITVGNITVPERDNIQLDIYFVQLAENYNHQLGVGWPSTFGSNTEGFAFDLSFTADVLNGFNITGANATLAAQPLPRIDFLQSTGWARVLRQASLVTANGEPASFSTGEEVNVVAAGAGLQSSLHPISAGASVQVTPRYDRTTGRIDLNVSSEMSDLVTSTAGQPPGRIVSNIATHVNLEMGQALIIGGAVSDSESNTQAGMPFLSQIPVLGLLFGTHQNRRNYTQTVLFVVPSIVDSVSEEVRQRINEALETYWDFSGGLDEVHFYEPGAGPSALHPDGIGDRPRDMTRRRSQEAERPAGASTPAAPGAPRGTARPPARRGNWRR